MTNEEITSNERYRTCGRCEYEAIQDEQYPCNQCKYGADLRKDLWEPKKDREGDMTREEAIEDIRLILHKIDLVNRPYIVYLHPDDAEMLKTELSEIEKKNVIQITPFIEKGKCVCMLREKLEELWTGGIV